MGDQHGLTHGRRKVLKVLAASGGTLAAGQLVPERWSRPVIDSIVLPAHAQATPLPLALSCVSDPPAGSIVGVIDPVSVTATITPNPGVGAEILFEWLHGETFGGLVAEGPLGFTDSSGVVGPVDLLVPVPTDDGTGPGDPYPLRLTYQSASHDCPFILGGNEL